MTAPTKPPRKPVKHPLSKAAMAAIAKRPTKKQLAAKQRQRDDGVFS